MPPAPRATLRLLSQCSRFDDLFSSIETPESRIRIDEFGVFLPSSGWRTGVHLGRDHREAHVLRLRRGVLQDVVRLRLAAVRLHLNENAGRSAS